MRKSCVKVDTISWPCSILPNSTMASGSEQNGPTTQTGKTNILIKAYHKIRIKN
jgi:hypothetical protein